MIRRAPLAWLIGAVSALPPAHADDGARRAVIEQKAALVQRVLADSPVVQRVRASGSEEARHLLAGAMASYQQAVAHVREGRLAAGEASINEAMTLIGRARQLVPDAATRQSAQRARHAQLLESAEGMLGSARRHLEAAAGKGDASAAREDVARADALIESARRLASADRFEEANRALAAAEQALLTALSYALGSATLDYTPRFESAGEEYRYEIERFGSLRQLVPKALQELRPAPEAARRAEGLVQEGIRLREAAERQAAGGDPGAALKTLREATEQVRRALAAAGLVVQAQ